MATNNNELVPAETLANLALLDTQLGKTVSQLEMLLQKTQQMSNDLRRTAVDYKSLIDAIANYERIQRNLNRTYDEERRLLSEKDKLLAQLAAKDSQQAKEVANLREQLRQKNAEMKNEARENLAAEGSINQLRAALIKMRTEYDNMGQRARQSAYGQFLAEDIKKLHEEVLAMEVDTGRSQRNVGNYTSAFNGLDVSVQQVARELPSITMGANQFFLAISNNIPILTDEYKKAGAAYRTAMQAGGDAAANAVHPMKAVLSSIFSWQTALVIVITLLAAYGQEIKNWIVGLFTGEKAIKALDDAIKSMNEDMGKELGQLNMLFSSLEKTTKGTKEYESVKNDIISKYGKYLEGQDAEIRNLEDMRGAYELLTQEIIKNAKSKALSKTYEDLGTSYIESVQTDLEDMEGYINEYFKDISGGSDKAKRIMEDLRKTVILNGGDFSKLNDESKAFFVNFDSIYNRFQGSIDRGVIKFTRGLGSVFSSVDGLFRNYIQLIEASDEYNEGIKKTNELLGIYESQQNALVPGTYKWWDAERKAAQEGQKLLKEIQKGGEEWNAYQVRIDRATDALKAWGNESNKRGGGNNRDRERALSALQELLNREEKAEIESGAIILNTRAQNAKLIVANGKASFEDRIEALNDFEDLMISSIEKEAEVGQTALRQDFDKRKTTMKRGGIELAELEKSYANQSQLIESKKDQEITKIYKEYLNLRKDITKDELDKQIKAISDSYGEQARIFNKEESEKLKELAISFNKREGIFKNNIDAQALYGKASLEISKEYDKKRFDAEEESLEKILTLNGLSEKQIADTKKQVADKRLDYDKKINDKTIDLQKRAAEKQIDLEKEMASRKLEIAKETSKELFGFISTVFDAQTERQLAALDKQSKANKEYADKEIDRIERLEESGAISKEQADARKQVVDDNAKAREAELEEKRQQATINQAKTEKTLKLLEIGIDTAANVAKIKMNTAAAIMLAFAQFGPVLGAPLAASMTALGGINIAAALVAGGLAAATVAAQPLPQYAHGTDDHKGGYAIVGDGGRKELVITPAGKMYSTPDIPALMDIPKHSIVMPDLNETLRVMATPVMLKKKDEGITTIDYIKQLDELKGGLSYMNRNNNLGHEALQRELIDIKKMLKRKALDRGLDRRRMN
jgi:ABC-type transporter Mla subunit MlaD